MAIPRLVVAALALGACTASAHDGVLEQPSTTTNGVSLNGVSLNGVSLNGVSLNGVSLNGVSLNGVRLNGVSLNGVSLNGSELAGNAATTEFSGRAWIGATLTGQLSNGLTLTLRIDAASMLAAPNDDVWVYDVKLAHDEQWSPLCENGAIALSGTWNYGAGVSGGGAWSPNDTAFTFACRGTALAKCVELGYKPWVHRDHHQACTRMIRADYCGDGTPHTFDGWRLNVFDDIGMQAPTPGLAWSFEAHWGAGGASCMSEGRALDLIVSSELPSCVASRLDAYCTDDSFADGSLLQNYYDPWSVTVALEDAYRRYPSAKGSLRGAMDLLDQALGYLALDPARPRDAAQKIEQAVTKLKSAIGSGLPVKFGRDLMRRYALLVRSSLEHEIDRAEQAGRPLSMLATARKAIIDGDALVEKADYPNATNRYKNGIGSL